jgi:hypothetical protein
MVGSATCLIVEVPEATHAVVRHPVARDSAVTLGVDARFRDKRSLSDFDDVRIVTAFKTSPAPVMKSRA